MERFCKDCKHRIAFPGDPARVDLSTCALFNKSEIRADFLVTGEGQRYESAFCSVARGSANMCGEAARRFEPILAVA